MKFEHFYSIVLYGVKPFETLSIFSIPGFAFKNYRMFLHIVRHFEERINFFRKNYIFCMFELTIAFDIHKYQLVTKKAKMVYT